MMDFSGNYPGRNFENLWVLWEGVPTLAQGFECIGNDARWFPECRFSTTQFFVKREEAFHAARNELARRRTALDNLERMIKDREETWE